MPSAKLTFVNFDFKSLTMKILNSLFILFFILLNHSSAQTKGIEQSEIVDQTIIDDLPETPALSKKNIQRFMRQCPFTLVAKKSKI